MAELPVQPPLLPWKLTGLMLLLLALATGWRVDWNPWRHENPWTLGGSVALDLPQPAPDQRSVIFIGNSRLAWAVNDTDTRHQLMGLAGLSRHVSGVAGGPDISILDLGPVREQLAALDPELVIIQFDCLFPLGPAGPTPDTAARLSSFEWNDHDLYTSIDVAARLSSGRRVAVEVPWPQHLSDRLAPEFWTRRAAARAALRGRGYEVIADDKPWPDALFDDGIHLGPQGRDRFASWLGQRLAQVESLASVRD